MESCKKRRKFLSNFKVQTSVCCEDCTHSWTLWNMYVLWFCVGCQQMEQTTEKWVRVSERQDCSGHRWDRLPYLLTHTRLNQLHGGSSWAAAMEKKSTATPHQKHWPTQSGRMDSGIVLGRNLKTRCFLIVWRIPHRFKMAYFSFQEWVHGSKYVVKERWVDMVLMIKPADSFREPVFTESGSSGLKQDSCNNIWEDVDLHWHLLFKVLSTLDPVMSAQNYRQHCRIMKNTTAY